MPKNAQPTYSPKAHRLLLDQLSRVSQGDAATLRHVHEQRARIPELTEIHRRRGTLIGEPPSATVGETLELFGRELGPGSLFEALAELALALEAEVVKDPPADERADRPTPDRV